MRLGLEPRRLIHIWVVSSNKCTDVPVVERGHPSRKLPTKHGLLRSESDFIRLRNNRLAVIRGAYNREYARLRSFDASGSWERLTVMTLKNRVALKKKRPALCWPRKKLSLRITSSSRPFSSCPSFSLQPS